MDCDDNPFSPRQRGPPTSGLVNQIIKRKRTVEQLRSKYSRPSPSPSSGSSEWTPESSLMDYPNFASALATPLTPECTSPPPPESDWDLWDAALPPQLPPPIKPTSYGVPWRTIGNERMTPEEYRTNPFGEDSEEFSWGPQSYCAPDFYADSHQTYDPGMKIVGYIPETAPEDSQLETYLHYSHEMLKRILEEEARTGESRERYDPEEFVKWVPGETPGAGPRLMFPNDEDCPP